MKNSRIEKLIKKLCPDGVEYRELRDLVGYEQPSKYIVKDSEYSDEYKTPVLTAGQTFILGYTNEDENIFKADENNPVIIFDDFTTSFHWVDFAFKVKSSAMKILLPKNENADFRYVYYAMECINFMPQIHARHWISKYSKFKIPLPPLDIQKEIVKILNEFTELEAELEAELESRKKQYEYYRDLLLTFGDEVEWKTLDEIARYAKSRIEAREVNADTYVGVDNLLPDKMGKTTSNYVPLEGRLIKYDIGDILIGNIRPYLKKIWLATDAGGTNGDVLVIRINDRKAVLPKYLYFVLSSDNFFVYNMQNAKGAKMPRGDKTAIMKYPIPVPPLEEQERIVAILDRFDALCNDLTSGIPAEIEARQKQYEYYRDKLLSFKEVTA